MRFAAVRSSAASSGRRRSASTMQMSDSLDTPWADHPVAALGDGGAAGVRVQTRADARRRVRVIAATQSGASYTARSRNGSNTSPPIVKGRPPSSPRITTDRRSVTARPIRAVVAAHLRVAAGRERVGVPPRRRFEAARAQLEQAHRLATDDAQRAAPMLALAQLDATGGALGRRPSSASSPLESLLRRRDASSARKRSAGARGSPGSPAAGMTRSPPANGAVAALAGLPESPQLARALARLSQIEMLHATARVASSTHERRSP